MAKTVTGTVSSNKGDKTIVVTVSTRKTHPLYKKQYTFTKKFMAHDENNEAQVGDKVSIMETRPLSARKRYTLERIVETAAIRHTEAETPALSIINDRPSVNDIEQTTRNAEPKTTKPEVEK